MEKEFVSTGEAADILGVTRQRVLQFIEDGRLKPGRLGNAYMIRVSDLALLKDRKPGRPTKKPAKGKKK